MNENTGEVTGQAAPAAEVQTIPSEYSALRNSQPAKPEPKTSGESPDPQPSGAEDPRSPYIPRDRFDDVLRQRDQAQQQLQALLAQSNQQPQQPPQQVQHWGGMQVAQPNQAPQPQNTGIDLNNPEVLKEWQEKIANGGVKELASFFTTLAAPVINQLRQESLGYVEPLRQNYIGQQVDAFVKSNPDAAPVAQQLRQAVQFIATNRPNVPINPQTLGMLAYAVKGYNAQYGQAQTPQQPLPYSERPGSPVRQQNPQVVQLNPEQQRIARMYGMTNEEYAKSLSEVRNG